MKAIFAILWIQVFFGFLAGHAVIIAKLLKTITIAKPALNLFLKFILSIIIIILINLPGILLYATLPPHDIDGKRSYQGYHDVLLVIELLFFLTISLIGVFTVIQQFYLRYKALKKRKSEQTRPSEL